MKNYRTIRAGEIQPGDVLKCSVSVWDDTIKAVKHWERNFITVTRYYKVVSISNNGTCKGKDKNGSIRFISINPFTGIVNATAYYRAV
jgi:hypothetical protein